MKKSELKQIIKEILKENANFGDDVAAFKQKEDPIKKHLSLNKYSANDRYGKEYSSMGSPNSIMIDGDTIAIKIKGKTEQQIPSFLGDIKHRVDIAMFIDKLLK